jgi:hypothetical protein
MVKTQKRKSSKISRRKTQKGGFNPELHNNPQLLGNNSSSKKSSVGQVINRIKRHLPSRRKTYSLNSVRLMESKKDQKLAEFRVLLSERRKLIVENMQMLRQSIHDKLKAQIEIKNKNIQELLSIATKDGLGLRDQLDEMINQEEREFILQHQENERMKEFYYRHQQAEYNNP